MSIKHVGLSSHRLASNPLEAKFASAWKKMAPTTLGYLLCGQNRSFHDYSERDAVVAATVIQWLGSPVGESFVREVLNKKREGA
jgi:hypothetical protein